LTVWVRLLRYFISLPISSRAYQETVFPISHPTTLDALFQSCAQLTLLCHPILQTAMSGIGFSTDFPSPTLFSLGLGPGLLWADEPSPENLRFSAGRILTCLFVYLYRHSHLYALHSSFRYSFYAHTTLPYHLSRQSSGSSRQDLLASRNL
jgi:hypothetical protein